VKRFAVIGNKVVDERDRQFLETNLPPEDYLGWLPYEETIRRADRENVPLVDIADPALLAKFKALWAQTKARAISQPGGSN
jgi:CO dehydrogenase nickel-insertion accessory protein CooC1